MREDWCALPLLDDDRRAIVSGVRSRHIVDLSKAVTAQRELIGHSTHSIFSSVERKLARMRVFRRTVRNDHLGDREAVEDRANLPIVVVGDSRQRDTLAVVERCMEKPLNRSCKDGRVHVHLPMCIFHFCHSMTFPSILKLTPSG